MRKDGSASPSSSGDGGDGSSGIVAGTVAPRILVLAAEYDVLCTPAVLLDAARRYQAAFAQCVREGKISGLPKRDDEKVESGKWEGVRFTLVKGVAHHLQNHVEWERGAESVLSWVEEL